MMQFDLFEAMSALTAAVETALPVGHISDRIGRPAAAEKTDNPSFSWEAALPPEEGGFSSNAEILSADSMGAAEGLRDLSDRLELESLRYVRFLDTGVNA